MAKKLTKQEKDSLNHVYKTFGLNRDHIHVPENQEYKIINKAGIAMIKRIIGADITYDIAHQEGSNIVTIHGKGYAQSAPPDSEVLVGWNVEDFGEVSPTE